MSPRTFGILLFLFGFVALFFPRFYYFFLDENNHDPEPSGLRIFMTRAFGLALIVFSMFGMFGFEPASKPDPGEAPKAVEPKSSPDPK